MRGARKREPQMCNCTSGNIRDSPAAQLRTCGLVLRTILGMTARLGPGNHDAKEAFTRRDLLKGSAALALHRVRPTRSGPRAGTCRDHAGADRGREEGRQGRPVFLDGPAGRREARQGVRGGVSGDHRADRTLRLGTAVPRIDQEFASNIRAADIINTSDASHFIPWKANDWLMPFVSEDIGGIFRRVSAIPTACSPPRGSGCRRSPTTPTW